MKKFAFMVAIGLVVHACTWVKLTPQGEKVVLLEEKAVTSCKRLGTVTVTTKADIAGIDRSAGKVKSELEALARNHAVKIDGNTIVPASKIENGVQKYVVYDCMKP